MVRLRSRTKIKLERRLCLFQTRRKQHRAEASAANDRVARLISTNSGGERVRTDFATTDCWNISANGRCGDAVLRPSENSSGRSFVFVDLGGNHRRDLFLEIRRDSMAPDCCAAALLFAALVQHARRNGRDRGRESESAG